ncbi:intercompartmental signaling factor BofC [Mesobacillus sp. AQ2]|jgi:forespore regulator of the sigma-K checkpoint|uniref:intercompartmental signaling factor BofC n=1 Tax=unclassified Mesobacillus TaxID=2675270 RepID=UPI00119CA52C|nr:MULTISPECIES: intercompartmental signaling factor BofC [Bacillaceae]MCM3122554.1 intercompartmental signaling factor BofC [Mesobacillus sp. MER 33]MCM3232518.1 intercompartmental signaling factor BofC [Mesobacillus sp. MER 48]WHX39453.1 intercompartmental signaling factor BofC [Mesobacillus sp. AQ2]
MASINLIKAFSTAVLLLISLSGAGPVLPPGQVHAEKPGEAVHEFNEPLKVTIILQRIYLDGEMSEEKVVETVWSLEDFWAKYDKWQLVDMDAKMAVFRQDVDDISPLLKANGYFGLSDEGVLTIFNGRPDGSNIIQSFFQIDLGRLESIKRDQLKKGIPIRSKQCYEEVLETFKPYTVKDLH